MRWMPKSNLLLHAPQEAISVIIPLSSERILRWFPVKFDCCLPRHIQFVVSVFVSRTAVVCAAEMSLNKQIKLISWDSVIASV
jgi:hypothetical protein